MLLSKLDTLAVVGNETIVVALVVLVSFFSLWKIIDYRSFHTRYRFPNLVPVALPIVGNALQMPSTNHGPFLQKLSQQYGEMFTMKFGSSYWVFLNSRRVAQELLEKRAAIYSSRQNLTMAHDLVSGGNRILLMPYGDLWRRERKVMHQILNTSQQRIFEPYQDIESRTLLYQYLANPEDFYLEHGRFANSVIMGVVFGRRTRLDDPDLVELLKSSAEFVTYIQPGRAIVDLLPFLSRIPFLKSLQPWRWYGDALYRRTLAIYQKELSKLEERRKSGEQKPCFMTEFFDQGKEKEFTADQIAFTAGTLMEAGSDTTRVSLHEALAGAALWPDWVQRAREQLDKICGPNAERLPGFADMDHFPIIKGAVKESIRWKPSIAESGIPHALTKDDEFEGYRLPAGTIITWNHWAISNSPDEYEQPERFWPERFINEDLDKPPKGHLGFGAGRRVCVGYSVGINNLCIALARIVYCFDIEEVPGKPIDVTRPFPPAGEPFKIKIKPRSEAHRLLIERECKDAAIIP